MPRIPDREEVYQSWLRVKQLEAEIEKAKREHEALFNARYLIGRVSAAELRAYPDLYKSTTN